MRLVRSEPDFAVPAMLLFLRHICGLCELVSVRTRRGWPRRCHLGRRLAFEGLEDRRVLAAGFAEFFDPHPADGNQFGASVVPLSTGNVVITSPLDDAGGTDAGAVYLFNGRTGELISTLTGSHEDDRIGVGVVSNVVPLPNGNYLVISTGWHNGDEAGAGAVTYCSGVSGLAGTVSEANSLVG